MTDEQQTIDAVSPHTRALSLYIQQAVSRLRETTSPAADGQADEQQSRLIFFGNWQDPYPRLLVTDPILEPVDKIVWQIIRTHITTPGAVTAFPSYSAIRTGANVKSNHTVSRAITILRATRWLSLCERVRDKQGRFLGNIYALHDEPITLGDAMYLDSDYIDFLQQGRHHNHLRVCRVIESVLATIQDVIDAGRDATAERIQTGSYARRIGLFTRTQKDTPGRQGHYCEHNQFYALSDPHIAALGEHPALESTQTDEQDSQVQNMHTADPAAHSRVQQVHMAANIAPPPVQKTHTVICSSSCSSSKNINTTTTTTTGQPPLHTGEDAAAPLHFPPRISVNERSLAMMYLKALDDAQQQDVLDEWHGRLHTADKRGNPINNPIGYLAVLCQRAKTGEFQLTIGLQIREAREREQHQRQQQAAADKRHEETLALLKGQAAGKPTPLTRRLEEIQAGQRKSRHPSHE